MRIVVLVKEVPDTYKERSLSTGTGLLNREKGENVVDEISDRALEVALSYRGSGGDAHITVLTMGSETASGSLRKCLARGADEAVHIVDDDLVGADIRLTAEVLAAALQRYPYDLIIAGDQSYDGAGGVLPVMIAEILGIPALPTLHTVNISSAEVTGSCTRESLVLELSASYPALISITQQLPPPGFPDFKGVIAAKKKPIEQLSLSDIGLDMDFILATPRTILLQVTTGPPRQSGVKIVDGGNGASEVVDFLAGKNLI